MNSTVKKIILLLALPLIASTAGAKVSEFPDADQLPVVEIIFFSPKDIDPPETAVETLRTLALQTEEFFETEMASWNYPIKRREIFARNADDQIKVTFVRGSAVADTGKYDRSYSGLSNGIIKLAEKTGNFSTNGDCFWIFVYLGEKRQFNGWVGRGSIQQGGYGIVRFEPGKDIKGAKTKIHELGHSFTLPHLGPKVSDQKGDCNIMGPNNQAYRARLGRSFQTFYFSESVAARLWKHPLFTGTLEKRGALPKKLQIVNKTYEYDKDKKSFLIKGQVESDLAVHSVIIHDESTGPNHEYWMKTYVSRVGEDGSFTIEVDELSDHQGTLTFHCCHEGGTTSHCKEALPYDFKNGLHTSHSFIPHEFPLACGKVKEVVSAQWGSLRDLRNNTATDVTKIVQNKLKDGVVSMKITPWTFRDRNKRSRKRLAVKYILEGETKERSFIGGTKNFLILPPLDIAYPKKENPAP